jgi:hypothetical protein
MKRANSFYCLLPPLALALAGFPLRVHAQAAPTAPPSASAAPVAAPPGEPNHRPFVYRAPLVDGIDRDGAPVVADFVASPAVRPDPDPDPTSARVYLLLDLRWEKGAVSLLQTTTLDFGSPRQAARVFGRFALEAFRGKELVERVRFDFPMLGASDEKGPLHVAPGLRTRVGVYFPAIFAEPSNLRLELVDRRTGRRWLVPTESPPGDAKGSSVPAAIAPAEGAGAPKG